MAGRVEGKVALITRAARGQGRAHALRLAQEGADIIAVDACESFETVPYGGATEADLAETVKQVEDLDRRILTRKADVRLLAQLGGRRRRPVRVRPARHRLRHCRHRLVRSAWERPTTPRPHTVSPV